MATLSSTQAIFLAGLLLAVQRVICLAPEPEVSGPFKHIEQVFSRLYTPKAPLDVSTWLPDARPKQPWPYRSSAVSTSVQLTETHAIVASVQHAGLHGVTSDMLVWWFNNIPGTGTYPGDQKTWSKYLMWHPRDHIYQRALPQTYKAHASQQPQIATESSSSSSTGGTKSATDVVTAPVLWEICEFILCANPDGWITSSYPGSQATVNEQTVKAVTQVKQLNRQGLWLSLPSTTGLGDTFWQLRHAWVDTPEGLLINSTQVVGVVQPAWRPMWFARARNAILRGIYGSGRDPKLLLSKWLQHCIEEMGNLEHILPSLYTEEQQQQQRQQHQGTSDGANASVQKEIVQERQVPAMHLPAEELPNELAADSSSGSSSMSQLPVTERSGEGMHSELQHRGQQKAAADHDEL